MKNFNPVLLVFFSFFVHAVSLAQYVEKERNDTVYLMPKTPFDTVAGKKALARGTSTIKGVAFTRRASNGSKALYGGRINANKIKILLFPLTPYFQEYLDLKKKENPKRLKFAFMSNEAWRYRLEAITNSDGEFTFPEMKPGIYYLEGMIGVNYSGTTEVYAGRGNTGYGDVNYYKNQAYSYNRSYLLTEIVEVKTDGEMVKVKLN